MQDASRPRIGQIQNLDEHLTEEDLEYLPDEVPVENIIDPVLHKAELDAGYKLGLDRLIENSVFEDTPMEEAVGGKHISTRWENKWALISDIA